MVNMKFLMPALFLCQFLAGSSFCEEKIVNIDELPHKMIDLPNGSKAEVIQFKDHWWRVIDVNVLSSSEDHDPDVCLESKFDMLMQPDKLKLFGVNVSPTPNDPTRPWASIIVDDRLKRRAQTEFKRSDNMWMCGTVRRSPSGKGLEFTPIEILKQPPDAAKFEFRIGVLEKKGDFEGLIDLGQKILIQTKQEVRDFADYDKLGNLSRKAFEVGLQLKEKSVKADDVDALYELALQWRDKGQRKNRYRDLVEKVLKLRPDHPQAGRDAEGFGLKLFEGKWLGEDEIATIVEDRKKRKEQEEKNQKAFLEQQQIEMARAIEQRPVLLVRQQSELRESKNRERSLTAFGEVIQRSSDVGFGKEGIEMLSSLDAKLPVAPALGIAAKSQLPAVRKCALEALAFRGSQHENAAYDVAGAVLRDERDVTTAKAGISALVAVGGKGAVDALVAGLGNGDKAVRDEFLDGLKSATRQQFGSRDEWEKWWKENKDGFKN